MKEIIKWVGRIVAIAADCKSADFGLRWFESNPAHYKVSYNLDAYWVIDLISVSSRKIVRSPLIDLQ